MQKEVWGDSSEMAFLLAFFAKNSYNGNIKKQGGIQEKEIDLWDILQGWRKSI